MPGRCTIVARETLDLIGSTKVMFFCPFSLEVMTTACLTQLWVASLFLLTFHILCPKPKLLYFEFSNEFW